MMYLKGVMVVCVLVLACASVQASASSSFRASMLKSTAANATVMAGVAKINGTLPIGTPLAGYNHGTRRVPDWPLPVLAEYTTFMEGAQGNLEPTWIKTLVIQVGGTGYSFTTIDGIGSDGTLNFLAYQIAAGQGYTVPFENCIFSASHSHSGPGAISPEFLWAMAPATDLMVPSLQRAMATSMATSMIDAQNNLAPAKIAIGSGMLLNATVNRRANESPYVSSGTIDPHLGVLRVDDVNDNAIATLWNFAMHGTCYGPSNMKFSGDIAGASCTQIESMIGGVAVFMNADAGDIDPAPWVCGGQPNGTQLFTGAPYIAQHVVGVRANLTTSTNVQIQAVAQVVPFGPTNLNYTLERFNNCDSGGPLDICTFCKFLRCDLNAHFPESWIEQNPIFTAMKFTIDGINTVIATVPGEALVELGWQVRNDSLALGFNNTFIAGYSNSHMGYFATPNEYDIGGYESQLTLWGIQTSDMIRTAARGVMSLVQPN
eukprot:TRINITY_DN1998_c0_g1_i1.p1 TRINITY_DN1998_c0_g1~~TRINITY_DN1998_c0_g1_i1.p1  ORF type:complete len:503 (+),score=101.27 TRINITY_DN1998_c0_g1_i1:48-1511(+)